MKFFFGMVFMYEFGDVLSLLIKMGLAYAFVMACMASNCILKFGCVNNDLMRLKLKICLRSFK